MSGQKEESINETFHPVQEQDQNILGAGEGDNGTLANLGRLLEQVLANRPQVNEEQPN